MSLVFLPQNALRPMTRDECLELSFLHSHLSLVLWLLRLAKAWPGSKVLLLSEAALFIALCVFTAAAQHHLRSSLA